MFHINCSSNETRTTLVTTRPAKAIGKRFAWIVMFHYIYFSDLTSVRVGKLHEYLKKHNPRAFAISLKIKNLDQ